MGVGGNLIFRYRVVGHEREQLCTAVQKKQGQRNNQLRGSANHDTKKKAQQACGLQKKHTHTHMEKLRTDSRASGPGPLEMEAAKK